MTKIKLAIQKSGRLSEESLHLLKESGIDLPSGTQKLIAEARNFPLEVLFLRDDDIPQYVEQKIADLGILGENEVLEQKKEVDVVHRLGFARCRLSLAIPKNETYEGLQYFSNKRIATSYPNILKHYFQSKNISVDIEPISGSVEIAPGIGLADAICDLVSSGSTLLTNGLKEVEPVLYSEAVMIGGRGLTPEKQTLADALMFRFRSVIKASNHKYILMNVPNATIPSIISLLPGMKSPSILPLAEEGWSSLHSVVQEDRFWEVIDRLRELGAEGILVVPIEKMIQ